VKRSGFPPLGPPAAKICASQVNNVGANNVFVKIPLRYDEHNVPNLFTYNLNDAEVSITEPPLDSYELDGEDVGEEVDDCDSYG
jgi:hypothetical protein